MFSAAINELPFKDYFAKEDYVAVKIHLGNYGSYRTIRPVFVRKLNDMLKGLGAKPFVTESVRVKGLDLLEMAAWNGYTAESLGAPLIVADGIFGADGVTVPCDEPIKHVDICSAIYHAQGMLVLSHTKGHIQSGFGGALKNLGMGCLVPKSRGHLHFQTDTEFVFDRNLCSECLQCVEICPLNASSFNDDGDWVKDEEACWNCGRCARVCQTGALKVSINQSEFNFGLAAATKSVIDTFKKNKIFYVNFMHEIQPECDCMPAADVPVVQDQGILFSDDPVAIDMASLDMINKAEVIKDSLAGERGKTSEALLNLHGSDPYSHILNSEKLGLGSTKYELINLQ